MNRQNNKISARGLFAFSIIICLFITGTSCKNLSEKKSPFAIVENKKPTATIVIGKDAGESEVFAAEELRKYVKQISRAELEIKKLSPGESVKNAIVIGTEKTNPLIAKYVKDSAKLEKEAFSIKVSDGNLLISGGNGVGTLYGVYELLEHFGCRWFFPDKQSEVIPSLATLTVDSSLCITEKPSLKGRETWQGFGLTQLDWLAKSRCNYMVIPWFQFVEKKYDQAKAEIRKRGITIELGHDNIINFWLPPDRYFKTHPEYYCLIDGQRKLFSFSERAIGSQFCFSNHDAAREVAANMCKFLDTHPEIKNIGIGISDAKPKDSMCQCENCQKLHSQYMEKGSSSYTGPFLYFANNVAELVAKQHPEAVITVGAYEFPFVFAAPVNIKAAPNLRLIIYLFLRDGSTSVDFADSQRNNYINSEIKKWEKVFDPERIVIGDYYYGMSGYRGGIWPIFEVIPQDFKYFKTSKFHGASLACGYQFSYRLNTWLFYKYAWNANANINVLLDDFCNSYFGQAAAPMRRYVSLLADRMRNYDRAMAKNIPYSSLAPHTAPGEFLPAFGNIPALLDENTLKSLDDCITEARSKVPKDGIVAKRIDMTAHELDRSACYVRINNMLKEASKLLNERKYEETFKILDAVIKLKEHAEKCHKPSSVPGKSYSDDFQIPDVRAIYDIIKAKAKGSEKNLISPDAGKPVQTGNIESVTKAGKMTAVNRPAGWNCYHGEGSGQWGTCADTENNMKSGVFLEATGTYEWPDGKKTVNIGITPSGSNGYKADDAYEIGKDTVSRTYGLSFMARSVGNPSVKVFVWGWNSKGERKFIPIHFLKPIKFDSEYSLFTGTFSVPDEIVKFTPIFRLASLGRLEINDVAMFHLRPTIGIYMPDADISLTYGLHPVINSLSKNDLYNTTLITNLSEESLKKCHTLLIPMMQSVAMENLCKERKQLRKYVQNGGNVFILRSACGYKPHGWPLDTTIFPEICKGVSAKRGARGDEAGKKLTVIENDMITFDCKTGIRSYWDHYALTKGDAGKNIIVDNQNDPVVIAGTYGKGKVVFDGLAPLDGKTESACDSMTDFEEKILLNSLRWFIVNTDSKNSK